jgi:hypothetical protein
MVVRKNYQSLVRKLTKQVKVLERKEEKARRQLGAAIKKMRKLGRTYKTKLSDKLRTIKTQVAAAKTSTYIKVATHLERKMLKNIQSKAKALTAAIAKIEKKQVSQLTKSMTKKRKTTQAKKPARTKKVHPHKAKKTNKIKIK